MLDIELFKCQWSISYSSAVRWSKACNHSLTFNFDSSSFHLITLPVLLQVFFFRIILGLFFSLFTPTRSMFCSCRNTVRNWKTAIRFCNIRKSTVHTVKQAYLSLASLQCHRNFLHVNWTIFIRHSLKLFFPLFFLPLILLLLCYRHSFRSCCCRSHWNRFCSLFFLFTSSSSYYFLRIFLFSSFHPFLHLYFCIGLYTNELENEVENEKKIGLGYII